MSSRNTDNLLLIAARAPVAGQTKTRLGATIGMDAACHLYQAFLADLAARFTPTGIYDVGWAHTPADVDFTEVLKTLGHPPGDGVRCVAQRGDSWAARQEHLLAWGRTTGYTRTVLIASDSPHLDRSLPTVAFASLADHDVVIGRTVDGGYYLVGIAGSHESILAGIPMSTASVADTVVDRAAVLGLRVAELPATFDVDEAEDLDTLRELLRPDGAAAPVTWAALQALDGQRQTGSRPAVDPHAGSSTR